MEDKHCQTSKKKSGSHTWGKKGLSGINVKTKEEDIKELTKTVFLVIILLTFDSDVSAPRADPERPERRNFSNIAYLAGAPFIAPWLALK